MDKSFQIGIPEWLKERNPISAQFCEMVNVALAGNPNMSLAEFAAILDFENKRATYENILAAEREQFGSGVRQ